LLIIALIAWTWLSLGRGETRAWGAAAPLPASARPVAIGLLVLVAIQLASGALVAGLDAGRSYTDWPLMAGEVFPSNYVEGGLGFRSLFEGRAATQFNHRLLAYLLWGSAILAWVLHRGEPVERSFSVFALLVSGQAIWGILTLVNAAPLSLALLHQGLGVVILLAAVTLVWRVNARVPDKPPLTVLA
ncbi:MAG: COX15/CtaA family protein, partial [Pseudomonadota bacterium]